MFTYCPPPPNVAQSIGRYSFSVSKGFCFVINLTKGLVRSKNERLIKSNMSK